LSSSEIETVMVEIGELSFEVDCCGEGGKLALCLHGFPENNFSWRKQLPVLADMGYKVWAPNLRGYGNSYKPAKVSDYSIEKLLNDIVGLIDASDSDEVTIIAHDWGGILAWIFASRELKPLKSLVIMNCPHPVAFKRGLNLRQLLMSWYMYFFQIPFLPEWYLGRNNAMPIRRMLEKTSVNSDMFPQKVTEVYRKHAAQNGTLTAMINYYRALFRYPPKMTNADSSGEKITVPTLLIWGEQDLALSKDLALKTSEFVVDLQTKFIPNGSHWIQQDCPEEVNKLMIEFLSIN
jgi:pimeloyl-ACP methyl ester carboxylesterase